MLSTIVHFVLRFRGVVIALSVVLLAYGISTISEVSSDVFPEFAQPLVEIQTEAPGLAPEQVEALVTLPVEGALNGMAAAEVIRSSSIQGLSVVTVTLKPDSDIFRDRQAVAERLATLAGQLPQGIQPPAMSPLTSSTGDLMTIGISSKTRTLMELGTMAEWTIKRRLLSVPGVAKVGIFGGDVRQIQIHLRPDQLIRYDLSFEEVLAAVRRATGVMGAGFIDTPNQRITLRTEGQSTTAESLAKTVLTRTGASGITVSVPLGEVARVTDAPAPHISAASIMGTPAVVLNIWAQYGASTPAATQGVEEALADLRPMLEAQGVTLWPDLFRAANFIETATHNLEFSLLLGAALVIIVLFLFLFDLRTAAISCTAIPLSLLGAVAVLANLGMSLNSMTLGGLAIAIGEVVDDAVINVENILRRLRENRMRSNPLPTLSVIRNASTEVMGITVYAAIVVAMVFIPVLVMSGVGGRLFAPLGVAFISAIFVSLLVAITVTPALCFLFLGRGELRKGDPPLIRWLKASYRRLLLRIEGRSRAVILAVVGLTFAGVAVIPFMGGGFLPELKEGHFLIHMTAVPGTSLAESLRAGSQVTAELLKIPFVRTVAQRVGRAESDDTFGTHSSELEVDLKKLTTREANTAQEVIRKALEGFPGFSFVINTFLTERVEETLSGYTSAVVINIFGTDLDAIDAKAQEVAKVLGKVPGVADIQVQSPPGTPQLAIRIKKDALALWGLEPVEVLEAIHTAYEGETASQIYEGNQVVDVSVILEPSRRRSVAHIGELPLRSPTGSYVKLSELVDISESSGRYVVLHEGARRVQVVTCNVQGRDIGAFTADARREIQKAIAFTGGTSIEFSGTAVAQARSKRDLLLHALLAGIGIVLLLSIAMRSVRNLILVLLNIPFALVGGVIVAFLSGGVLSIGSIVGFVTLFGITLRNSVLMISHFEYLVAVEGVPWGREAAIRGASERLAPILMTALVTAFGLLPLALGSGTPGREIEGPMAVVILGGLVTSSLLNLLVLPTLALHFGKFKLTPEHGA